MFVVDNHAADVWESLYVWLRSQMKLVVGATDRCVLLCMYPITNQRTNERNQAESMMVVVNSIYLSFVVREKIAVGQCWQWFAPGQWPILSAVPDACVNEFGEPSVVSEVHPTHT